MPQLAPLAPPVVGPSLLIDLVALAWLAAVTVPLSVIDVRTHRLPDRLVLPGYVVVAACAATAALLTSDTGPLLRAGAGAGVWFGLFLVLRLISPAGMGGGDVKLAGVLGAYLGEAGPEAVCLGLLCAFVLGGAHGIVLLLRSRSRRDAAVAFGPWMLAGTWIGILTALLA